jgi:hypothetical protein
MGPVNGCVSKCKSGRNREHVSGNLVSTAKGPVENFSQENVNCGQDRSKDEQATADPDSNLRRFFRFQKQSIKHIFRGVAASRERAPSRPGNDARRT